LKNIFVHGRLRRGGLNHSIVSSCAFLGEGRTAQQYALCVMNNKPLVTKRQSSTVKGEVYSVDDPTLQVIDRFEGHPHVNKRELVLVQLEDGQAIEAWIYFHMQPLRDSQLIESGDYAGAGT
jgi:gamma-glutamylcyclotransferase (GGCT)/AIG2-like uncharacterized protein YtfP